MSEFIVQQAESDDAPFAVFIMGPTATGKTDLAMACAEALPMDLISVDSAMVYQGMDIGSAKPDAATLMKSPHRLVDVMPPTEAYSAGQFRDDALHAMQEITASGRIPLLVGGTMLYFNALQKGIAGLPEADPVVRERLEAEAKIHGWAAMHQRLAAFDPVAAERLHPNDPQRIQRAMEVYEITGKTLTDHWAEQHNSHFPYRVVKIALMPPDRIGLRKRIEQRFDSMLVDGFIEEVRQLLDNPTLSPQMPSMKSVGYRQIGAYLAGEYDYATMREKAITATAHLAKRQMTWLRSEQNCNFIDPEAVELQKVLKKLRFLLL